MSWERDLDRGWDEGGSAWDLPPPGGRSTHKVRGPETWRQVRRAWEAGETAQSCARRFDVGLDALWRRRAKENWSRGRPEDPSPEPPEGWEAHAARLVEAFERRLAEVRELAVQLADAIAGRPVEDISVWHLAFLYHQRAEKLGPETAAEDRERVRARGDEWFDDFWDANGRLKPLHLMDRAMRARFRDDWRAEQGLPEGAAAGVPCAAPAPSSLARPR